MSFTDEFFIYREHDISYIISTGIVDKAKLILLSGYLIVLVLVGAKYKLLAFYPAGSFAADTLETVDRKYSFQISRGVDKFVFGSSSSTECLLWLELMRVEGQGQAIVQALAAGGPPV